MRRISCDNCGKVGEPTKIGTFPGWFMVSSPFGEDAGGIVHRKENATVYGMHFCSAICAEETIVSATRAGVSFSVVYEPVKQ